MQKKQLIGRMARYFRNQLLLEDDFSDEQAFHLDARRRHSRQLHGFGVVHGLEVTRAGEAAVSVSPGYAIDRQGQEIELSQPETLQLQGLPPAALVWVTIGFVAEPVADGKEKDRRIDCYAFLRVATGVEPNDVRLATLQLDERSHLVTIGSGERQRDDARIGLAAGSVSAEALAPALRKGWVTMSFHPSSIWLKEEDWRPPFRIGATRAIAHKEYDGKPNIRGAAGTMAIPLPPGVRRVTRFRIAGEANEKELQAVLAKGGFDHKSTPMKHLREDILTLEIKSGPFSVIGEVPEAHRDLQADHGTYSLSVDVRSTGYASISLVSVEVSY